MHCKKSFIYENMCIVSIVYEHSIFKNTIRSFIDIINSLYDKEINIFKVLIYWLETSHSAGAYACDFKRHRLWVRSLGWGNILYFHFARSDGARRVAFDVEWRCVHHNAFRIRRKGETEFLNTRFSMPTLLYILSDVYLLLWHKQRKSGDITFRF